MKINGVIKLVPNLYDKKKYVINMAATQSSPQTQADLKANSSGDRVQPKHMVSTIHQFQHPTEDEGEERVREGLLQANEQLSVWKDDGEHQEA